MRSFLTIVAAVNDEHVLAANLLRSPMVASGKVPIYVEKGHCCAGSAYNAGLRRAASDYVIFTHQDIYFPTGWDERLRAAIESLELSQTPWAIMGVWGVQENGEFAGRVWCNANNREFVGNMGGVRQVVSFDEVVLVLKTSVGLRFDEQLPSFHLYGTDIVLEAKQRGFGSYAFDGPVIHNCRVAHLDASYGAAYTYMRRKWSHCLPITNCVVPVTRWGWPLIIQRLRGVLQRVRHRADDRPRLLDVRQLAVELGYEQRGKVGDHD